MILKKGREQVVLEPYGTFDEAKQACLREINHRLQKHLDMLAKYKAKRDRVLALRA